jgi:hypothetical protein
VTLAEASQNDNILVPESQSGKKQSCQHEGKTLGHGNFLHCNTDRCKECICYCENGNLGRLCAKVGCFYGKSGKKGQKTH